MKIQNRDTKSVLLNDDSDFLYFRFQGYLLKDPKEISRIQALHK